VSGDIVLMPREPGALHLRVMRHDYLRGDRRSSTMNSTLAYLDPGSSSVILQMLAGGIAAVAVTAKLFWGRILRFLRIKRDDPEAEDSSRTKPGP
jgi:hypothetical protein